MLYQFLSRFLTFALLLSSIANADLCTNCSSNRHQTSTTIAPVIRLTAAPIQISDKRGFSFLGEIGARNYRAGVTFGGDFNELMPDFLESSGQNRFKISAEFLSQSLQYKFGSGSTRRWVNQYAVGGGYQFKFSDAYPASVWIKSIDIDLSYSHALSRRLKNLGCNAPDDFATTAIFRNIAGGDNIHGSFGCTVTPWDSGALFIAADYDYTFYSRKYESNKRSSGAGATVRLNQRLPYDLALEATTEFRRPFNYYEGAISWSTPLSWGALNISSYVSYTNGRDRLPNNTTAGLSIDLAFGGSPAFIYNNAPSFDNSYYPDCCSLSYGNCDSDLLAWIARPAVYMPTVLAISDQLIAAVILPCVTPTAVPFPTNSPQEPINLPFDAGAYFSGTNLVFSLGQTTDPITINPVTGLITATEFISSVETVTVIATNSCGVVQQLLVYTYRPL